MYKTKILLLTLLTFLSFKLSAQQQDKELIKQTIEMYFDGWMTGDTSKIGKVMHSTCNLKTIKDNEVILTDRKSYLGRFKLRPKLEHSFGRVISIDVTGRTASAKCEIEIPERIFTDYFNMMKINDKWYIMDKISTNIAKTNHEEINNYIADVLKQYHIPGLALAVIRNGEVIHKNNYGLSNVEMSVPVTDKTLFPLFSTTKVMSVVAVYQLIEQHKLSLDNSISDFLDDLPENWRKVQIKNLLTHSSGLPDIVNYTNDKEEEAKRKVYTDTLRFAAGKQFDYNQTNFWLLNRIFQKVVGKKLSEYIIDAQFPSSAKSVIFEGNNLKVIENLSYGYVNTADSNQLMKRNWTFPEYEYGAAALNITLDSFVEWNRKFDHNEFITAQTKTQLLTPFSYEVKRDFTYGLDLIKLKDEVSYGFSGGVSTAFRKFTHKNLTVILLANGMFIPTDQLKGINEVVNNIAIIASGK